MFFGRLRVCTYSVPYSRLHTKSSCWEEKHEKISVNWLSGSMSPAVNPGELYFFERTDASLLKTGDIVLAYSDTCETYDYVIHRIVEIREDRTGFVLKGDNTHVNDSDIYNGENILGALISGQAPDDPV